MNWQSKIHLRTGKLLNLKFSLCHISSINGVFPSLVKKSTINGSPYQLAITSSAMSSFVQSMELKNISVLFFHSVVLLHLLLMNICRFRTVILLKNLILESCTIMSSEFWTKQPLQECDSKCEQNSGQNTAHIVILAKGQTISEWIYEVIVSPKIRTKNCQNFCPVYCV